MTDHWAWWQSGVIYQIYPRSFQDSNGDGVGDLPGIMSRLGYIAELGVDAIWISPIYPSPMADFGYDISDYVDIDPVFGSLADFDALLAAAHERGLKVVLDYVPNHTSDRHPWFVESKSSRTSAKRDWYVWHDGAAGGGPPNNWISEFSGSAWTFDEQTGQYYYHAYLKEQPDLNWRNADVQTEMLNVLRFWLDRGVDGFRIDAIHHLFEDPHLRDNPPNPDWQLGDSPSRKVLREHTMDQPEVHGAIARMREVSHAYAGDRVLIGEAYLPFERLMHYYGVNSAGFQLPFNFHLMRSPWDARSIATLVEAYEAALPANGWPNWVLGNHDRSRLASRLGGEAQARLAAMLLLTLRGTPTLYQGDEIGMKDVPIGPEEVRDPWEKNVPGLGLGRDPVRTPIQWDSSANSGFTSGSPWLPLAADYAVHNIAAQAAEPQSMLNLYKQLLHLRRLHRCLSIGAYLTVEVTDSVLIFERLHENDRLLVALNFSAEPVDIEHVVQGGSALLSTHLDAVALDGGVPILRPAEGVIITGRSS